MLCKVFHPPLCMVLSYRYLNMRLRFCFYAASLDRCHQKASVVINYWKTPSKIGSSFQYIVKANVFLPDIILTYSFADRTGFCSVCQYTWGKYMRMKKVIVFRTNTWNLKTTKTPWHICSKSSLGRVIFLICMEVIYLNSQVTLWLF